MHVPKYCEVLQQEQCIPEHLEVFVLIQKLISTPQSVSLWSMSACGRQHTAYIQQDLLLLTKATVSLLPSVPCGTNELK